MPTQSKGGWAALHDIQERKRKDREKQTVIPPAETPVTPVTPVAEIPRAIPDTDEAAPKRDFQRVANSITREAVPSGIFTGKGKQLYDFLYAQTRGAIVPKKSARIPTDTIMKGAGMTRNPFRVHIQRLIRFGLIEVEERPGEHGGNVYTVHLPNELYRTHRGDRGHRGDTGEKVTPVPPVESHPGDPSLNVVGKDTSGDDKTLYKTIEKTDDDEACAGLVALLREASRDITGKGLSAADAERWREVAEVLVTELRIAAGRTNVSNVPAFFAEHLRRRLWKRGKGELEAEVTPPGKNASQGQGRANTGNPTDCPDCFGTGMWYPEGYDKGVARCRHEKLSKPEAG